MLDLTFYWLPFVVIAVVNFFISWMYYSPAAPWFRAWQVGVGMDPNKRQMTEADRKAMPRLMGGAAVASLLFSYGLQVAVHSIKAADFGTGVLVGIVIWLAFVVTHSLNTQFEGRKPVVLLINNVLYLVTYAVGAGVVAIDPMFDFSVFRIRRFSGALLGSIGMNFSFWPFMIYLPLYFQNGLGYASVATGLSLLAYTLPTLVLPPLAERLIRKARALRARARRAMSSFSTIA